MTPMFRESRFESPCTQRRGVDQFDQTRASPHEVANLDHAAPLTPLDHGALMLKTNSLSMSRRNSLPSAMTGCDQDGLLLRPGWLNLPFSR